MRRALIYFFIGVLLTACSSNQEVPQDSGIFGQVLIGPTCPVMQAGMDCEDKPYQAEFIILDSREREVARFQSNADGSFKVTLSPGEYTLQPVLVNSLPFAPEQDFMVSAGQFTEVTIVFDSGIR